MPTRERWTERFNCRPASLSPTAAPVMLPVYPGFLESVTLTVTRVAVAPAAIAITFPSLASNSIVLALAGPVVGAMVVGKRF